MKSGCALLQYHSGRVYCVGDGGLSVLELSRSVIATLRVSTGPTSVKCIWFSCDSATKVELKSSEKLFQQKCNSGDIVP